MDKRTMEVINRLSQDEQTLWKVVYGAVIRCLDTRSVKFTIDGLPPRAIEAIEEQIVSQLEPLVTRAAINAAETAAATVMKQLQTDLRSDMRRLIAKVRPTPPKPSPSLLDRLVWHLRLRHA